MGSYFLANSVAQYINHRDMVDSVIADCICNVCERHLLNPDWHGSHSTKEDPTVAFRCYYCGRFFCSQCMEEHIE